MSRGQGREGRHRRRSHRSQFKAIADATARDHHVRDDGDVAQCYKVDRKSDYFMLMLRGGSSKKEKCLCAIAGNKSTWTLLLDLF